MSFRDGNIIIIGDEPNETTFSVLKDNSGIMLIRLVYAENETSVISHISNLQQLEINVFDAPKIDIFDIESEDLILFDSACLGYDIHFDNSDSLEICLEIGRYQVSSYFYKPDENTALLLHKIYQLECS